MFPIFIPIFKSRQICSWGLGLTKEQLDEIRNKIDKEIYNELIKPFVIIIICGFIIVACSAILMVIMWG